MTCRTTCLCQCQQSQCGCRERPGVFMPQRKVGPASVRPSKAYRPETTPTETPRSTP